MRRSGPRFPGPGGRLFGFLRTGEPADQCPESDPAEHESDRLRHIVGTGEVVVLQPELQPPQYASDEGADQRPLLSLAFHCGSPFEQRAVDRVPGTRTVRRARRRAEILADSRGVIG